MKLETLAAACLALVTLTGCDTLGDDAIGPEGGVVISVDGRLTVDIPAGALADAIEITIEQVDDEPEGALGPSYRVEPVGLVFETPVQVLYNYSAGGMDVAPEDVTLMVARTDGWNELADRSVWDDEEIVSASALYLSTFCAVER
ncbi:hypothetical protein [Paraliomyxa miuraensis]|uniref:hypothetical protein n=1 Tax=Paraliomyxa miuraensis TaxID=376150 RepID=UPI002250F71F|nr:hypothetical protein [Paraliomyxa miuraensis]MCX4244672.1 hypothetical protein [Paraliomyxa miuraensis]